MARYKDLYTPASNYGQVYRGGLRQRTEAQEKAGQNMVDFAGDIYNLVDRQRQRKLQEQEAQSLERERASVQASRKARTEREAEQARFNKWITKLNSAVGLHKEEQAQIDRRVYSKYGGLQPTIKAYREMREGFERRIAAAPTPAERRTIYMQYRDIFDDFIKPGSLQPDARDDDGFYRIGDDKIMSGFRMMSEQDFVQRMKSDDPGTNKYQPLITSLLSDPEWGVGFVVDDAKNVSRDTKPVTRLNEEPNAILSLADRNKASEIVTSDSPEITVIPEEIQTGSLNPSRKTTGETIFGNKDDNNVDPEMGDDSTEEYTGQQGTRSGEAGTDRSEEVMSANLKSIRDTNPWIVFSTDSQGLAVNEMLNGIGLYLRSKGRKDSYQERAKVFDSFKKLKSIMSGDEKFSGEKAWKEFMSSNVGDYLNANHTDMVYNIRDFLKGNFSKGRISTGKTQKESASSQEEESLAGRVLRKIFQRK